jgi:N-acetylmuramoyl-L-alanine amidase
MRVPRARFLHILVIAPVAAIAAGVLGPTPHALAATAKAPAPIVVTVDPAFGGQPTPANPNVPFDPGVIGVNGLLAKDVDLDVGKRLAALLRADLVDVVMTRSTDVYMSAARREQISVAHHAVLVISVAAATAANPNTRGSLVLYPSNPDRPFAQILSDALAAQVATDGLPDGGVALGDAAWARSRVPAVTVEMGYLSNGTDATLMATTSFRQDVAEGVRDGVEAYMPAIISRRNAILAWRTDHPAAVAPSGFAPASAALPGTTGFQFEPVIAWLLAIVGVGLLLLFRDAVARVLVVVIAIFVRLFGGVMWLRRAAIRRRRRRQRSDGSSRSRPIPAERRRGSVYDDIPL